MKRTWYRSLKKAIKKYSKTRVALAPDYYRMLTPVECGDIARLHARKLTAPVRRLGTHLIDSRGPYIPEIGAEVQY